MTGRLASLTAMFLVCFGLIALTSGCAPQNCRETFVRSGICGPDAKPPEWVQGKLPSTEPDQIYFVGRGVAYNVLDERAAYDNARDHALQQLGKHIATWVSAREGESDVRQFSQGARFLKGESAKETLGTCARLTTEALAGDLVDREIYWEEWQVEKQSKPHKEDHGLKRYKCWVLVSIDAKKVESRLAATMDALRMARAYPNTLYRVTGSFAGTPGDRIDAGGARVLFDVSRARPR